MNRSDIIERAIKECLNELYEKAQPSITYDGLVELSRNDPEKHWYNYFYLSQKEITEIMEDYISAYRIRNEFHDDMKLVKEYLRDGGTKDKYVYPKDGSTPYRGYEKTPKLKDVIGEEAANIALGLIDECDKFYNPNREETKFIFNVSNYAPCCNIDIVRQNRPDEKIYKRVYDEECEVYREVDDSGKFIYGIKNQYPVPFPSFPISYKLTTTPTMAVSIIIIKNILFVL